MRLPMQMTLAVAVLAMPTIAQAQMRFQELDINGDGVITRAEWRGNNASFRNQDRNQDGILSGNEVRTDGRRQTNSNQDWNGDGRVDNFDTQISQRFRGYDMNSDDRVARSEWPGSARLFTRLDTTRDGYLSLQEYTQGDGFMLDAQGGPSNRFSNIDTNNDGWVSRKEWNFGSADFNRLDLNRDGRVSRFEFETDTAAYNDYRYGPAQFNTFDANRDGWLTRPESQMGAAEFDRFDANGDNRISQYEFDTEGTNGTAKSAAWRAGYERGTQEGRAAGSEDYVRRHGWDLDGQRELELADSGYTPQVGTLRDYQDGYRDGFRSAYRAGFTDAGGRAPR